MPWDFSFCCVFGGLESVTLTAARWTGHRENKTLSMESNTRELGWDSHREGELRGLAWGVVRVRYRPVATIDSGATCEEFGPSARRLSERPPA